VKGGDVRVRKEGVKGRADGDSPEANTRRVKGSLGKPRKRTCHLKREGVRRAPLEEVEV